MSLGLAVGAEGVAIYDELIDTPNGKGPQPALAESFAEAPDRKSWTLKIRDGVTFHDGTKLNADAVKFNLERQRKSRVNAALMALIKNIEVTDPMTIKLSLDKPYAGLPYLLSGGVGIMVSPKAVQEKGDKFNREPSDSGTGPYILKEWTPGDHATVVRNPNYWGNPKPRLDQITFRYIFDESARYAALQAGDVQSITTLSTSTTERATKDGFQVFDPPYAGSAVWLLNNSKPPFDDIRIRRAALLAIDDDALQSLFNNPKAADSRGFGLWPKDNSWHLPGRQPAYDKAEARRLVLNYMNDTGKQAAFTFTSLSTSGPLVDAARLLVKNWQDAGFDAKLQLLPDANPLVVALLSGQYEAAISLVGLEKDPDATASPVLSSTSQLNFARYKSAEMDAALEEGRVAADPAARKAAYDRVQTIFRRDLPFIVFNPGSGRTIATNKVCGLDAEGPFPSKTVGFGNC